ncbi:phage tail tube protein [Sansalvadorimonas verongulae]|uniref:phage tail tube protein n=1 Tax=Sansalvadorimonas verongulae TaxID=2172824 RepID=UPI0012BCD01E|nr:phage tail tube protein [Sansalvadorimonas verongulae]MTI13121.1 hypothetical protein [Sansalvadorimonas verongulae]
MPGAKEAKIGAGTILSFEDPDTSTFIELVHATSVGATGEQGEFVETTPLKETTRTYTSGMKTPPDKQIIQNHVPGDDAQKRFLGLVNSGATLKMKVTYSNGAIAEFDMVTAGYQVNEPHNNNPVTVTAFGKQSGETTWTDA